MPDEFLPIKVLLPNDQRHQRIAGGGSSKTFVDVTPALRRSLSSQVAEIENSIVNDVLGPRDLPRVARVRLRTDALAKSHRPERLLSPDSCPIIGVGKPRELYIRVTQSGIAELRRRIERDNTKEGLANISSIESFSAIGVEDRVQGTSLDTVLEVATSSGLMKFQLFDHLDERLNTQIRDSFRSLIEDLGGSVMVADYAPDLQVLLVSANREALEKAVSHSGVRRAGVVPRFYKLRHESIPVSDLLTRDFPVPEANGDYGIVAIVDSGIAESCGPLQPWVIGREVFVAKAEEDREHGTFVGALAALGSVVNGQAVAATGDPCRVLDIAVLPDENGVLTENELVAILQQVVPKYRDQVKVWNLSLGSDAMCSDVEFSDFAHFLDALQADHGVQFLIAAGNFEEIPARSWPPPATIGNRDRIFTPADSALAITVGSLAHLQSVASSVKVDEPSPFTRRGPGPAHIVKPEVVHYGGNCDPNLSYSSTGIRSLDTGGRVAEDVGTSFATPLASATLANIYNSVDGAISTNLAKAILIHGCEYPRNISSGALEYCGFGKVGPLASMLQCSQSSATMIFEDVLRPGYQLELDPFPFPACLVENGKSRGTIRMTLVYTPPVGQQFGLEYCRANVEASLGAWRINKETGERKYQREVPPEPKYPRGRYEESLVRFGFKWCPTKSYRRQLTRGIDADEWRLTLELLHRANQSEEPLAFALLVTISGDQGEPVYNDLVAALRAHPTQDLPLKATVQARIRL